MDWKFVPQFDSILMFGFAKPPAAGRTAGESNFSAAVCSSCKSLLKLQADRFPTPSPARPTPNWGSWANSEVGFLTPRGRAAELRPSWQEFCDVLREWQGRKKTASTIFAWKPFNW